MDVSCPIAGDIGYVVVGSSRQRLTVELDLPSVAKLPRAIVARRVEIATQRALVAARGEDRVVELFLGDAEELRDLSCGRLEPLPGSDP